MKKINKKMVGFMIFLSIVGCSKQEDLFEYKVKSWTPSIPCCHGTAFYHSEIDNANDYLLQLYSQQGIDIFYVGGLEYYQSTDENSIRYDYVIAENSINGEVSDTLWRPNSNH